MSPEMSQDAVPDQHPPVAATPTPGTVLAAHRREAGLTVAEVSDKLKLSKRQVEALEADDYRALPGNTFVRGFVRNYARLLGLDAQPLIQFLDSHLPKETSQAALPRLRDEALPVLRPGGGGSKMPALLGVAAGLAIVFGGVGAYWYYLQHGRFEPELMLKDSNEPEPVAAVPPQQAAPVAVTETPAPATTNTDTAAAAPEVAPTEAATSPAPASQTAAAPATTPPPAAAAATVPVAPPPVAAATAPTTAAQKPVAPVAAPTVPAVASSQTAAAPPPATPVPAAGNGDLRVVARQDSWVQVTDASGRRLINQVLSAGESRIVGGTPPYKVRIGNGPHTELYYKGKPTDLTPYIKVDVANLELN